MAFQQLKLTLFSLGLFASMMATATTTSPYYNRVFEDQDLLLSIPKKEGSYETKYYIFPVTQQGNYQHLFLYQDADLGHYKWVTVTYDNGTQEIFGNPNYLTPREIGNARQIRSVLERCNQNVWYKACEKTPLYLTLSQPERQVRSIKLAIGFGYQADFRGHIVGISGAKYIHHVVSKIPSFKATVERQSVVKIKTLLRKPYTFLELMTTGAPMIVSKLIVIDELGQEHLMGENFELGAHSTYLNLSSFSGIRVFAVKVIAKSLGTAAHPQARSTLIIHGLVNDPKPYEIEI